MGRRCSAARGRPRDGTRAQRQALRRRLRRYQVGAVSVEDAGWREARGPRLRESAGRSTGEVSRAKLTGVARADVGRASAAGLIRLERRAENTALSQPRPATTPVEDITDCVVN